MGLTLDLNADLAESFGAWTLGDDAALLPLLTSASLACGFHAGDPTVLARSLKAAAEAGVAVGAHPSYPDLQGFGRRRMHLAADELTALLHYQLGALAGMARVQGLRLAHVKPHGALSNQACADAALARTVAEAVRAFDPQLILLAPACSRLAEAGQRAGLAVALEVFADRAYAEDGALRPRHLPGALLHEPAACLAHVRRMLEAGGLITPSGAVRPTPIHSVCVHGDTPEAVATARLLRAQLAADGHRFAGLAQVLGSLGA